MSGFHLVPVTGGEPVHLPPGETVLGRGPLLGVTDKRVSRNHGLLENLNGQLRLKPTHVNPCFIQSSPSDTPQPLQRDSWHLLQHGDLFSLLPGHLLFRVVAENGHGNGKGDVDATPRNSQMFEEEELDLGSPAAAPAPAPASPPAGSDCQQTPPRTEEVISSVGEFRTVCRLAPPTGATPAAPSAARPVVPPGAPPAAPPAPRRKRVLPAWMLAAVAGSAPSGSKVSLSAQQSKKPSTTSKRTTAKRPVPKREETDEEEVEDEEKEEKVKMPKKRRKRVQDEDEEEATRPKRVVSTEPPPSTKPSGESEGFAMEVDEEERETESRSSPPSTNAATSRNEASRPEPTRNTKSRSATSAAESAGSAPSSVSIPSSSAPSKPQTHRTPCPYGKGCYRKNPLHFQECSHPGDTDYEEEEPEEEGEESERPECPYGTDCYRKNPLHRKEYKHTQTPAYNTRKIPKKTQNQDSDLDSDQSGYDDSFIDDGDSEDRCNDSDYVPLDSDESDKEDVRRLQKEAKAFLRRDK